MGWRLLSLASVGWQSGTTLGVAIAPGVEIALGVAAQAEQAGFESVGVIDRLVYDNLDPLIALAAAAPGHVPAGRGPRA